MRRRLLAAADVLCLLLAVLATSLVEQRSLAAWTLVLIPLWLLIAKVEGLYDGDHPKIWFLTVDEGPALFHWVTVSVAATTLLLAAFAGPWLSPAGGLVMWAVALVSAFALRTGARGLWRRLVPPERGLVIGSGELATMLRRKLSLEPGHHTLVAMVMESGPNGGGSRASLDLADLDRADLEAVVQEAGIERVVLGASELDEPTLVKVVRTCQTLGVKLSVAPPMRAMLGTAVELNHVADMPVIEYRTWAASRSTMALKRTLDLTVAAAGLVLFAPLMLLIALAIKLDSRGPALFVQQRAGRYGKAFRILKFRTMVRDAEELIPQVVKVDELSEPMFKLRNDPRVTRVGRFLRRTSLDELPQLINVLRGDMSLVGPRPEALWLVARYGETESFRLQMRPGITGPMQVHGRGELTFQERLAVEREYVEKYSLSKDLKILLRTVSAVVLARGAF